MTINSSTKAINLNADRLDGLSASSFAAYKRTVIVSPVGTNTQNGQALLDALASINDASASKPYLLYIEPDTYDLGNRTLKMKQWVDIEGSGELNTVITSASADDSTGTVQGADNAELRFLTVRRIRSARGFGQDFFAAIANFSASARLTNVTARTTGRVLDRSIGVNNDPGSNPTMTDVTAAASDGDTNVGVQIQGANVTIREGELRGSGPNSHALRQAGSGSAKVALSQLVGGVTNIGDTLQCFNNYNQNMAAVSCP